MVFVPYEFEFFVTEAEYSKLQAVCPDEFSFAYAKFVAVINQRLEKRLEQITTRKAYVDVAKFIAFCTKHGIRPDENARITYAQFVGNNQIPT